MNLTFKVDTTSYRAVANEGAEPIIARRNPGKGGIWIACAPDETKKVLDQLEAAHRRVSGQGQRRQGEVTHHGQAALHGRLLSTASGSALRASHDVIDSIA